MFRILTATLFAFGLISLLGCSNPQPGPDKTATGAVLGAGWGAGAGAIVGHQIDYTGQGAAVGAGFGAVSGALSGAGYDLAESAIMKEHRKLNALRVRNQSNSIQLARIQDKLDRAVASDIAGGVYQVFFDPDATNLRAGAIANLEVIADSIKSSPHAYRIFVLGHADDAGTPEYNQRLSEARARAVSSYLTARGISADQVAVQSYGSSRPIATNATDIGRQLNRRVDVYIGR